MTYTATGLTLGTTYEFKVEARNTNGFSLPSADFIILHATAPETPSAPSTTNSATDVYINWSAPDSNGASITSYTVTILQSDGSTFSEDIVNCDGSDSTILTARQCKIPLSVLTSTPYSLS